MQRALDEMLGNEEKYNIKNNDNDNKSNIWTFTEPTESDNNRSICAPWHLRLFHLAKLAKNCTERKKKSFIRRTSWAYQMSMRQAKSRYHKFVMSVWAASCQQPKSIHFFPRFSEKTNNGILPLRYEYTGDLLAVFDEDPNLLNCKKYQGRKQIAVKRFIFALQDENKAEWKRWLNLMRAIYILIVDLISRKQQFDANNVNLDEITETVKDNIRTSLNKLYLQQLIDVDKQKNITLKQKNDEIFCS